MARPITALGAGVLFVAAIGGCGKPQAHPAADQPRSETMPNLPAPKLSVRAPSVTDQAASPPEAGSIEPSPPPAAVLKERAQAKVTFKNPQPTPLSTKVGLELVDLAGYERRIAEFKGKIVAVDAWATWCIPCVKKFPKFVELSHKFGSKGVVFVSLSADLEDNKTEALAFLEKHAASFLNLLVTDELTDVQNRLRFEGIPQYLVYSADGKIVLRATEVEAVEKTLAELVR